MNFRVDNYMERWAQIYKPIQHNPAKGSNNKRFFRMDSILRIEEFAASIAKTKSPCMGVVTQFEATLDGAQARFIRYTHRIFFFVKQTAPSVSQGIIDELAATEAKAEGQEMAFDLLAYLENDKKTNPDLKGLDFDTATVFSVPQKFSGWWPTEFVIEQLVPRNLCVNPEKYVSLP